MRLVHLNYIWSFIELWAKIFPNVVKASLLITSERYCGEFGDDAMILFIMLVVWDDGVVSVLLFLSCHSEFHDAARL